MCVYYNKKQGVQQTQYLLTRRDSDIITVTEINIPHEIEGSGRHSDIITLIEVNIPHEIEGSEL